MLKSQGHSGQAASKPTSQIMSSSNDAISPLCLLLLLLQAYLIYSGSVAAGAQSGIEECKYQFAWDRWNCPERALQLSTHSSLRSGESLEMTSNNWARRLIGFQNMCLLQVSIGDWSKDFFPLNDDTEMFAYSNFLPPPRILMVGAVAEGKTNNLILFTILFRIYSQKCPMCKPKSPL